MPCQFLLDAQSNPELFDLKMPASLDEIAILEKELEVSLPASLHEILTKLGQGAFFDNETLLGVHETNEGIGTIAQVNQELRDKQGLPRHLVVFHLGTGGMHAIDMSTADGEPEIVELDEDTLEPGEVYSDFDDWYLARIREEYESLLGLE